MSDTTITDLLSMLLGEHTTRAPELHDDGTVSHFDELEGVYVTRARRIVVRPGLGAAPGAFSRQPAGVCRSLFELLVASGWRRLVGPLSVDELLPHDYLIHPDVQVAPEVMAILRVSPFRLADAAAEYARWSARVPVVDAKGLLTYWSWSHLALIEQAYAVALHEVSQWCDHEHVALGALLEAGWRRDREVGDLLVHPNAARLVQALAAPQAVAHLN